MRADELRRGLADLGDTEPVDTAGALAVLRRRRRARRARIGVVGAVAVAALGVGAIVAVDPGRDGAPAGRVDVVASESTTAATDAGPTSTPEPSTTAPTESGAPGWAPAPGAWTALPPAPLSPRSYPVTAWTGSEVLVVGGLDRPPCPPGTDCSTGALALADGAAFDPDSGTWRSIEPVPLAAGWSLGRIVVDGPLAYALAWPPMTDADAAPQLLSYSIPDDRWAVVDGPAGGIPGYPGILAVDERLVLFHTSYESGTTTDLVLDLASGVWSELPPDPLVPAYDRTVVDVDGTLVVIAIPSRGDDTSGPGLYQAATLAPGAAAWERLPTSDVVGYWASWWVVGDLVVNPTIGSADGGAVNGWGRSYAFGGVLDPSTGTWSALPDAPPATDVRWAQPIGGDRFLLAPGGRVLDLATATWTTLPALPAPLDEAPGIAWAGDALFLWGGAFFPEDLRGELRGDGWIWQPDGPER